MVELWSAAARFRDITVPASFIAWSSESPMGSKGQVSVSPTNFISWIFSSSVGYRWGAFVSASSFMMFGACASFSGFRLRNACFMIQSQGGTFYLQCLSYSIWCRDDLKVSWPRTLSTWFLLTSRACILFELGKVNSPFLAVTLHPNADFCSQYVVALSSWWTGTWLLRK